MKQNGTYSKKKYAVISLVLIAALLFADQLTKQLARVYLKGQDDVILIRGVLQLHYLENNGAAFSMLTGRMLFFYIITPIFCAAVVYFWIKLPADRKYLPMMYVLDFIVAGAVGNYIDRVANRQVTDFIYFSLINFPVFNVADIYLTVSIAVLLVLIIFKYNEQDLKDWVSWF